METCGKDFDETDENILTAAERIFAEHGFHDTVVTDVAEEAGVGKGTVYRRFGNKSDLFSNLICEGTDRLIQRVQEGVDANASLDDRLRTLVSLHFDFYEESGELFRITVQEGLSNFGDWQEDVVERWTDYRDLLATYFKDEDLRCELREDLTPEGCSKMVGNLIWGTLRSVVIFEEEHPRKVYEEVLKETLLNGVKEQ